MSTLSIRAHNLPRLLSFLSHQDEASLASTSKPWNLNIKLHWEAYATARCGSNFDSENIKDYITHVDSIPPDACCISTHNGRVFYFKNTALKTCIISFRGTKNPENVINDLCIGGENVKKLIENVQEEMNARLSVETSETRLAAELITAKITAAKIADAAGSKSDAQRISEIFKNKGFTPEEMSEFSERLWAIDSKKTDFRPSPYQVTDIILKTLSIFLKTTHADSRKKR